MTSLVLLLATAFLAMNHSGPHYHDNNENGPLDKDSWTDGSGLPGTTNGWFGGLYRSFIRASFGVQEDSPKILQGLRDRDGNAVITRFNILNWSQFRCLPTAAGQTPQDKAEWLNKILKSAQDGVVEYERLEQEYEAKSYAPGAAGKEAAQAAGDYRKHKVLAQQCQPLLERVRDFFQRKAWIETLFAYIRGSHVKQHTQLQYTDHEGVHHNYNPVEAESNESKVVFQRASCEECVDCPERLVLSEQFANKPTLTGTDPMGKPHAMNLNYTIEHGWRVHYDDNRWFWNNRDVTVKFLNLQDASPQFQPQY